MNGLQCFNFMSIQGNIGVSFDYMLLSGSPNGPITMHLPNHDERQSICKSENCLRIDL